MASVFEKPSVERLVTGGTYILFFGLLAGAVGWLFIVVASRSDIGVGPELLGYITTANALGGIGVCISGGLHQGLSKYLSEALVESKEKALLYAKAGFVIFNTIGVIIFTIFIGVSIYMFQTRFEYGILFGSMAFIFLLGFFRDNFVGNFASIHRFDYIGKFSLIAAVANSSLAYLILFLVPKPLNAYLLPLTLGLGPIIQIILLIYYGKKVLAYSPFSVLRGARRSEITQIFKYGLYCIIPNIVFSGAILWIQNLWYSGFFNFATPEAYIVSINGLIIGYASIVFAICNFGWPQIPAVAEAKAMNNSKLIDDYMKNTLHTGFNITAFFLLIYVGLSYQILFLFHGPEYVVGHIPFVLLSIAVAVLGIEFLICTLLIGLGEGRKAAYLIATLTVTQIILVPLLIITLNSNFGADSTLYAGPASLLISSLAIFPLVFHYMVKYTKNPPRTYRNILGKGMISIILTLLIYSILELTILTNLNPIIGLIIRGALLFGFFMFFLLLFGGFSDADLDFYEHFLGPLKRIVPSLRWLLHHSPFYEPEEKPSA